MVRCLWDLRSLGSESGTPNSFAGVFLLRPDTHLLHQKEPLLPQQEIRGSTVSSASSPVIPGEPCGASLPLHLRTFTLGRWLRLVGRGRGEQGEPPRREGRWTVLSTCSTEPDPASEQLAEGKVTTYLVGRPGFQASLGLNFSLQKERTRLYTVPSCTSNLVFLDLVVLGLGLREA